MRRLISFLLLPLFTAVMLAPSLTLLDFTLRKASIERELCVQRDVAESMRTCHGECQLSRRLRALEQEAEQGFPAERLQFRDDPMVAERGDEPILAPASALRYASTSLTMQVEGHVRSLEHVPWC